jgi:hypothetical protein
MQRRASAPLAVLAAPVLLGLVAIASRPLAATSSAGLTAPEWIGVAADTMLQTLLIVLMVAAVAATVINVWAILPLPSGAPRPRPLRVALASYLYLAAAVAILVLRVRVRPLPLHTTAGSGVPGLAELRSRPIASGVTWIAILAALIILAVATLILLRWWRSLAGRSSAVDPRLLDPAPARDRLAAAVGESLDALRAEPDPRRAVIAAYTRLEVELAAIGRPRRPAEAPLEYVARILSQLRVDAAALRRLVDLFEWARFSQHSVDRPMKEEAIEALLQVRAGLAKG